MFLGLDGCSADLDIDLDGLLKLFALVLPLILHIVDGFVLLLLPALFTCGNCWAEGFLSNHSQVFRLGALRICDKLAVNERVMLLAIVLQDHLLILACGGARVLLLKIG